MAVVSRRRRHMMSMTSVLLIVVLLCMATHHVHATLSSSSASPSSVDTSVPSQPTRGTADGTAAHSASGTPPVLHQDPHTEAHHRLKLQFEEEQWQRLEQQTQARHNAQTAVATVGDVMAKLAEMGSIVATDEADRASSASSHQGVTADVSDDTGWPGWRTTPASPLEQSAHYYHAMEALYGQGNVSLFAERLRDGVQETGHGRMHYLLGVLYSNGVAVPHSESTAVLHFTFAALQGVPEAHLALAHRLETAGLDPSAGLKERCLAALPHYREAADAVAMTYDGSMSVEALMTPSAATDGAHPADILQDAHGVSLVEGSTPRAEALRRMQREQLSLVQLIVRSDDGDAHASLMLGLHHAKDGAASRRNWQLAERYFLKAIDQSPSFIELYLRKVTAASAEARLSLDTYLTPVEVDLHDYMLGEIRAGKFAAMYGMNPPLTAGATPGSSWTSRRGTKATPGKKTASGKKVSASGEPLPEPNSDQVVKAIGVAAHAYGFLGRLYATGDVTANIPLTRDFAKALTFYRRGIALQDCASLNGIGYLHALGFLHEGRTAEEQAAFDAAYAASSGTGVATAAATATSRTPPTPPPRVGSDFQSATDYFRVGTSHGACAISAYNMGVMMLHGLDNTTARRAKPEDRAQAARKARGNPFVSHMAEDGLFIPSQMVVEQAKNLFVEAAAHGSVLALWQLGRLAEREGDCRAATAFFRRVAAYGSWLHGDGTSAPWSFALTEDWRDTMLQERRAPSTTAETPAAAEATTEVSAMAPQYGSSVARRQQLQQEQHARLVAYHQAAQSATGRDREAFLRTLRQHATGHGSHSHDSEAVPGSSSPAHARPKTAQTGAAPSSYASSSASVNPSAGWSSRLVSKAMRLVLGWRRGWQHRATNEAGSAGDPPLTRADALPSEPVVTDPHAPSSPGALPAHSESTSLSSVARPASSPIVALIEGLALVETGFVDFYAAWRAVEVLEEGLQVPEDIYAALYTTTPKKMDDDADADLERLRQHYEAGTAQLIHDGWIDRTDPRFSASDTLPTAATALLEGETVLLQWRAPYTWSSSTSASASTTIKRPTAHRLLSQREAKKLLLHSLLQRYVSSASSRMSREKEYIPSAAHVDGPSDRNAAHVRAEQLLHAHPPVVPRLGQALPTALNRLGDFYYYGESALLGVDVAMALQYYRAASAQGHAQATFNAGMMLQLGLGNRVADGEARREGLRDVSSPFSSTIAVSPREATALVQAHPLTRALSVLPSLPWIGARCFGWVTRLEEAVTHLLTVPPELVLLQAEARHGRERTSAMASWLDSNDYLFMHVLHIFYKNPAVAERCDLHLAKRYYDTTHTLNPPARWAARVMLWTLRWQSWWLDLPYEDAPAVRTRDPSTATASREPGMTPPKHQGAETAKEAAKRSKPTTSSTAKNTAPHTPTQPAKSTTPAPTHKNTNGEAHRASVRATLSWLWARTPSYRAVENVVLGGAVITMCGALYLIFA